MAEDLTNVANVTPATEVANTQPEVVEEKPVDVVTENKEISTTEGSEPVPADTKTEEPTNEPSPSPIPEVDYKAENEKLQDRLKEYQLREDEIKNLSQRIGTDNVGDIQIMQARNQLDIIDNQAQQAYITLCNQYGVDYRLDAIEKSSQELLEKDPKAYYDLKYKLERLDTEVANKRLEVETFIRNKETSDALASHNDMLNASPALKTAITNYLDTYRPANPKGAIDEFVAMATPMYQEAFEMGRLYAQKEAMKANEVKPSEVLNNSIMAAQTTHSPQEVRPFTRADIAKMDEPTFLKYEKEITRQMRLGLIK